jgi:hypothetical protein
MSSRGAHVMRVVTAGTARGYFADQQGDDRRGQQPGIQTRARRFYVTGRQRHVEALSDTRILKN